MAPIRWYLGAAVAGYLVGSVSSTRLLARAVAPDQDLTRTEYRIYQDGGLVSHGVSPSALGARAGGRWGGLAAALDIGKAVAITALVQSWAPAAIARPVAATAAAAATVGHVYPAYHRFVGGFGQSPMLGGALVLDWVSVPVTTGTGWVAGVVVGDALVAREAWPALMVPYALWRRDRAMLGWAVVVNGVYWIRMAPEVRQRLEHYRRYRPGWRRRAAEVVQLSQ
jgi:glycerol-3-phosphate acyltransferase PlsY